MDEETGLYYFGARYYDPRTSVWQSADPILGKYLPAGNRTRDRELAGTGGVYAPINLALYSYAHSNPLTFIDPDGKDATVEIKGSNLVISTTIYIYGSGASQNTANLFQSSIMGDWNKGWRYTDAASGKTFDVKFDINVKLYNPSNPTAEPWFIPGAWNPFSTDNYINVDLSSPRSYVSGGDEGVWRGAGRGGRPLASDNPAPHEFGHLIGLDDRYTDTGGARTGWSGNIMAEPAGRGRAEQRNIDAILRNTLQNYKGQSDYKTKIDESNPSW